MNPRRLLRGVAALLVLAALMAPNPGRTRAAEALAISVLLDGEPLTFDAPPTIDAASSRVLVPMRAIFEALGATVTWNGATREVRAQRGGAIILLQVGAATAEVGGVRIPLDAPAIIVQGRTMVPLRFVSEALGAQVRWDGLARTASIIPAIEPYARFWQPGDVVTLDGWGDSDGDDRDLVALYFKEEAGLVHFRVDLLDLRKGTGFDLFLGIDFASGGDGALAPGTKDFRVDLPWDLLVAVHGSDRLDVFDRAFAVHPEHLVKAEVNDQLDFVQFTLKREALQGWDGKPPKLQAAISKPGVRANVDTTAPAAPGGTAGRAKLVLAFGNMFTSSGPGFVGWYDGYALDPGQRGVRFGSRYFLDAGERYQLPLVVIDAVDQMNLPANEYLGVLGRLRRMASKGLVETVPRTSYGHFLPWQPHDVDVQAIRLTSSLRDRMSLPQSGVLSPYEWMLTAGDLGAIREAGYTSIYAGDRYGDWFGWPEWDRVPEHIRSARKVHRWGGVTLLFDPRLSGYQGFSDDDRWGQIDWSKFNEYAQFDGTDGGLDIWWRRILADMASDTDQEQFFVIGTDLLLTPWGYRDAADRNLRWLAEHPWIEVVTFSDILSRGWQVTDHGPLGLAPNEPLDRYPLANSAHYNAVFWKSYYGGPAEESTSVVAKGTPLEGFADYVPYLRAGQRIPSGRRMGDDKTPGTIVHETLRALRSAPPNNLSKLAWLAYLVSIAEQTFHSQADTREGPLTADQAPLVGNWGGAYLHPGARLRANYMRQVNKLVAAARWADDVAQGRQTGTTRAVAVDLDLDDEQEYVVANDRVFLVFENDGGRLEYAFAYHPKVGPVQLVAPLYQFFPAYWGIDSWHWTDGEGGERHEPAFGAFLEQSGDHQYRYDLFTAAVEGKSLTFTSPDGAIVKRYTLPDGDNTVQVDYTVTGNPAQIEVSLAVNPLAMWTQGWDERLQSIATPIATGWSHQDGGHAVVGHTEAARRGISAFTDSPAKREMKEREPGREYPPGHWLPVPYGTVFLEASGQARFGLTLSASTP